MALRLGIEIWLGVIAQYRKLGYWLDAVSTHSGSVVDGGQLVWRERGGKSVDLISAEQSVHIHLLQDVVMGHSRGPLVLVQSTEEARALGPRGSEDGATSTHGCHR